MQSEYDQANWSMGSIKRAAGAIAAILVREGIYYAQSKAVFKAARERAGLHASPERRGGVERLTVEEELRFLDQAYAQDGRTGLMLQTLLETGARASELVQLRVEDVGLAERVITIRHGKGDKRREVPIRRDLAQLLQLHIGARRAGPLFASRQQGSGPTPHVLTRQRIGQVVRTVADAAGITKRVYPHLLRHTVATRLLALGVSRQGSDGEAGGIRLEGWTSPTCSVFWATRASPRPGSTPKRRLPRCNAALTGSPTRLPRR